MGEKRIGMNHTTEVMGYGVVVLTFPELRALLNITERNLASLEAARKEQDRIAARAAKRLKRGGEK
jgi:hypothetical protein